MVRRHIAVAFIAAAVSAACSTDPKDQTFHISGPPDPIAVSVSGSVLDAAGMPVEGADVIAVTNRPSTATTDAEGHFDCGSMEYTPGTTLSILVSKDGYQPQTWQTNSPSGSVVAAIKLTAGWGWPNGGVVAGQLSPSDPAGYVGEASESDYAWNMTTFRYVVNNEDDVIIDLDWEASGNASLRMWAQEGLLASENVGGRPRIRLPKGTSGTLIVGQLVSRLTSPVAFALSSERMAGITGRSKF